MPGERPEATRAAMQRHIVHSGELLADHFDARVAAAEADAAQADDAGGLASA